MGLETLSRRKLLTSMVSLAGAAASTKLLAETAVCAITPKDQEGPFYPQTELTNDNDLVRIMPEGKVAEGQVILIEGFVSDANCKPIPGARVEIWQACATGKYNHSEDTSPLKLDPNFQYWGFTESDKDGKYVFQTIIPGHYPAGVLPSGATRYRPPHIHYKVKARNFVPLTTQMYFDPTSFEDKETAAIVKKWNDFERVPKALTVKFIQDAHVLRKIGRFDIALVKNQF